ncbi:MAG: hypothetical protein JW891_09455 [Candidatus Lokiarchaeota archaeon]|nr:hypothetical protein [Candidatus Lokiarchaeota archaeon]
MMLFNADYTEGIYTGLTADLDGNGLISMKEAFDYANYNNDFSIKNFPSILSMDNSQYYETTPGLGARTYL